MAKPWERYQATSGGSKPWEKYGGVTQQEPTRGFWRGVGDTALEAGTAAVGSVGAIGDFISPGNRVSEALDDVVDYGHGLQSDVAKQGRARFQQDLEASEGIGDDLAAVGRHLKESPLQAAAQAVGSFAVPGAAVKGARALGGAIGLGARGTAAAGRAGGVAAGAALGGGDAAGTAYDLVNQIPDEQLLKHPDAQALQAEGKSMPEIREELATRAARDASLLPALAGGAAGAFGAERLLAGGLATRGGVRGALGAGVVEGVTEAGEEGLTQYEGQRAAKEFDPSIDPTKNVAAMAAMGAAQGGALGAGIGAFPHGRQLAAQERQDDSIEGRYGDVARARAAEGEPEIAALPAPDRPLALEGPQARPALPAPADVSAIGDDFVARPSFNIPADAPRGIRNNNPGNIERGVGFEGEVEGSDQRFATFNSPEAGIRALARNLLTYQERHGLNDVQSIINRWAPGNENNTAAYVRAVSDAMGVRPGDQLNLRDPAVMERLATAIIQHENGMQPYPADTIRAGIASALSGAPVRAALPAPTIEVDSEGQASTAQARRAEADRAAELGLTPDVQAAGRRHPGSLEAAFHDAATSPLSDRPEPTQAQKDAGNYKKARVSLDGLDISIENPEGSTRSGVDADGNAWSNTLQSHYGYIRGTTGADGDHVDAFIKPGVETVAQTPVFAIDQIDPKTGRFDETKLMLGYGSQAEAEAAYKANYAPDWQGMGQVTQWDLPTLKRWFKDGDTTKAAAQWSGPADAGVGSLSGQDVAPPGSAPGTSPVTTVMTPAGRELDVRYRVVDADQLVTSNMDDGRVNPRYPQQLQPRDRSRGTSQLQINDMAANIRPALLGASPTTSDGAPIVSRAGVVESGNGRTLALQRAYRDGRGQAYRNWLQEQGYNIEGMTAPMLVRQRETDLSPADLQAYTRESNERATLQMSAAEQAQADAQSIAPILGDYQGGDIGSAANRDFVRKFVRDVASAADRGSMVGTDGVLSQQGKRRIEAALMSAAYGSPDLVTDLFESADNDIKSIGGALLDVAGNWAQMREAARDGAIPADMDITENLVGAVNLVRRARAEGRSVNELAGQVDILAGEVDPTTQEFLGLFFSGGQLSRARGRRPVADGLAAYVTLAQSTVPGENMFGESPPTGDDILRTVHGRQRYAQTPSQSQDDSARTLDAASGDEAQRGQTRRPRDAGLREPAPGRSERSQGLVNERDSQTIDMFSGQGQAQADLELSADRAAQASSRRRAASRVPSLPAANSRAGAVIVAPAQEGKSAVIVESQQVATLSVGKGRISTPSDAAHALASLRKLPQENVVALLTDKDGKPISVIRHTIGRTSQADVMPGILAGHTARFPDATHVWLAHNHPSGEASLSDPDIRMTRAYADLVSGSGVQLQGMLAIGGSEFAFMDPSGRHPARSRAPIPARARTETVQVVERRFRRRGTLGSSLQPLNAPRVINDILDGEPGIVFLDAQLRPVASLPMSVSEMSKLKGTGGVDRVLSGMERANASAAMMLVPDDSKVSLDAARNVGTLLDKSGDVLPIDIIAGMKSLASTGSALTRPGGVVESRDPLIGLYGAGVPVARVQQLVDQVAAKMPGASGVKIEVVANRLDVQDAEGHLPSIGAEGIYFPSSRGNDGRVKPARIYLMANALESMERANQVLAHELVGHFGMEAMLGENFSAVLDDVTRLTAIPPGVKIGRQRPGDKYYATLDAVRQDYPDYSPGNQAREVLARMAETDQRPYFIERVWGHIRRFLRGLGLGGRYTNAEIKNMVVESAKNLRSVQGGQAVAGALSAAESLRVAESNKGSNVGAPATTPGGSSNSTLRHARSKPISRGESIVAEVRRGATPVDLPDAIIGQPLGAAGKHPDHAAAKAGDAQAAVRLVRDLVTPKVITKVRDALGGQQATIMPVSAAEATGHNAIPMVTAVRLGQALSLPVDEGAIAQSVKAKRSALGGLDRIFQQPEFDGPVQRGHAYFLVDDTLTQGGTIAALAAHIEQGGGRVLGSFALTGKQYSATLRLSPETLNQVRERYGDIENEFRAATGRGFDSLTESEGRYLAKHGTPDAVRNRILAEEHAARGGSGTSRVSDSRLSRDNKPDQAPPSEGLSDSGPMESRADTAGQAPGRSEKEPRYRGNVERPGENLGRVERELRQQVLGKMDMFSVIEPIQERVRKLMDGWQGKAIQGIFDQFAPLKNLNPVAYMQARLSKGADGAAEALLTVGKAKLTDGALDVDNSGGLVKVLEQLAGEHDHFMAWIAGNRAKRLKAEGRENLFTEKDIDILTDLNKGRMDDGRSRSEVYAKALKEFNALQQSVLDVAQEAGLINPESRKLWEHEFYVPFYRVMEEDGTGTMGPGQIGGLVGQRAFKQLKGGQEKLGDLLGNTLSNWSHLLSASMKNMAAQKALESAQEIGIAQRLKEAEKGSVRVMVNGKERHYLVDDPLVLDALTSLHYVGPNTPVMKAMRKFKHYLTVGVTTSPTFRIRNLTRDIISAMATTDVSYNPVKNAMDGWRGTSSQSPTYQKLLAGGGAIRFGLFNDGDQAQNVRRLIERGVESGQILDSQAKVKRLFRGIWDKYQESGDRFETINRAAIYEKARKDGKSHLEASYAARDLMDFTAGGKFASIRLLTQVVPFFNARLQGMYKLGRATQDDPRRFAAVTGAVAMASALFYMLGHDDEEYQALPDWARNTYWITRVGDKMVYIPKPFEVGALGTVVERMTELAVAGDDYQAKDFAGTLLHVLSDQLAMNPVPQLFKPGMYAAFNRDDFRGVNLDSMGQMRLPAEDRHTARTSAGAVLAGRVLNQSPQRIEYMLRAQFGWMGTQALNVADFAARPFTSLPDNPARDMSRVDNWFVVGDFVKESQVRSSKYIQRFYDTQREIEQIYAAYSEARKLGDMERARELAGEDELRLRPIYQAANRQMQNINRRIKQVDNDQSMDAETKAMHRDRLYQQRNRLAMMADQQARARR